MITRQLLKAVSSFSSKSEPFLEFLSHKQPSIEVKRGSMRSASGVDIAVSRNPVTREEATEFMKKKGITKKKVLVNVDPSHAIGMRRSLVKQYVQMKVYKGQGESLDVLSKDNPNYLVNSQEIIFNESIFMRTDPVFIERINQNKEDSDIQDEVILLYNKDLQRGGKRLVAQYSVPPEYVPIVEAAHNMENTIYFVGLNEYEIRLLLSAYLSLSQMKMFFMQSLKYVHSIYECEDDLTRYFKHRCKEFMWKEYYSFWQPINYQQLMTFKRSIKGYTFAHAYNYLRPENPHINLQKAIKDKEADAAKIEKHAILSVLFGDIWAMSYTRNPFMYLSSDYHKMSQEDKETVNELYRSFYGKYRAAKKKFFQINSKKQ